MTPADSDQPGTAPLAILSEAAVTAGDRDALDSGLNGPCGGLGMSAAVAAAPPDWIKDTQTAVGAGGLVLLLTARAAWRLDVAATLVDAAALRWPALAARRDGLRLALHEAVVNAVQHGCLDVPPEIRDGPEGLLAHARAMQTALDDPARSSRPVLVTLTVGAAAGGAANTLTARVRDSGPGFDPPASAAVMPGRNRARGRGLPLMEGICDRVAWSDGGRTVTLTLTKTKTKSKTAPANGSAGPAA
jgi:anti-sigma regulatory factor (Ser/Thr protein kinase)